MATESTEDADYAAFLSRSQAQYERGQNLQASTEKYSAKTHGQRIGSKTLSSESEEDFVSFKIEAHDHTSFASALGVPEDSCQSVPLSEYEDFTEVLDYTRSLGGRNDPVVYEVTQGTRIHVYIAVRVKGKWVGAKSIKIES
ncbi:hypothetical protein PYCC9005_004262 [Savitreella phatthalungensis]